MFKFNYILLLYVGIIYVVEINSKETLFEDAVKHKDRAEFEQKLHKIQSNEALPFVLFKRGMKLRNPTQLKSVTFDHGKMIYGTEFSDDYGNSNQMFFCLEEKSKEKCLVPRLFGEGEPLQCASQSQPIPVIKSEYEQCGENKTGNSYSLNYEICEREEYENTLIQFYSLCYDKKQQKTLFTVHTINSPLLLEAALLWREREVNYTMMKRTEYPILSRGPNDMELDEVPTSKYGTTVPGYEWQKLVSSEDMALASWRKTTFQETNTALQHKQLISLWDKISEYVRSNAIKMFKDDIGTFFYNGVFDLNSASNDSKQLSNTWVKLIMTTHSLRKNSDFTHGIAILMNNFIDSETSQSMSSNSESKGINGYCEQDLCIAGLKNEFNKINGRVRCCALTKKILELFHDNINMELQELYVPGVNVTEDHETLIDNSNLTDEKAEKALRQIQLNEILPIVLLPDPKVFKFYTPFAIKKIEIENKIIVNGSQFFNKKSGQQIFFCPQDNSNEKCLIPKEFGKFEPLKCTKNAIPVIRIAELDETKCGIDDTGILHEVVYEICPKQSPDEHQKTAIKIYEVCHNPNEKKVLYTRHQVSSLILLNSKLLIRERNIKYTMLEDLDLPLSNIEEFKEAASKENENSISPTDLKKSPYQLQKLVPSEDMPFATWKRATFQYPNVAWQHKDLITFWKKIDDYIKNSTFGIERISGYYYHSSENFFEPYDHSRNSIYTGVLNIPTESIGDENGANQRSEIWFKIVRTERSVQHQNGIVILMNNYLISKKNDSDTSNAEKTTLNDFCQENLCSKEFQNELPTGGQVRCCRLTAKISKSLGIPPNFRDDAGTLFIRGIVADTQELLQNRYPAYYAAYFGTQT